MSSLATDLSCLCEIFLFTGSDRACNVSYVERIRAASEQKAAEIHTIAIAVGQHICAKACRLWPLSARCPVGTFTSLCITVLAQNSVSVSLLVSVFFSLI